MNVSRNVPDFRFLKLTLDTSQSYVCEHVFYVRHTHYGLAHFASAPLPRENNPLYSVLSHAYLSLFYSVL